MSDIRRTSERRTEIVTLKLSKDEHAELKRQAEANFRTPGCQLRFLIDQAAKPTKAGS